MKVSREQAAENRRRIVETAARLFRERGLDGVGVAELMKQAGLTHGGFYGHFQSKDELMAEACDAAIEQTGARWRKRLDRDPSLDTLVSHYLTPRHRDHPGDGCVVAALANDAARHEGPVRASYTRSVRRLIGTVADSLRGTLPGAEARRRRKAMAICAGMVGGLILARAVDDDDLSRDILDAVAAELPPADNPLSAKDPLP